jgi:glycerate-2-kinase
MAGLAKGTAGPAALISGGECTVTIEGEGGRGGRCSEFLLSLGLEAPGLWAIAADTDGIDGSEDNAGAVWSPGLEKRSGAREALDRHDSYGFFKDAGTLVVTGPTRTNVNDYRAILVP